MKFAGVALISFVVSLVIAFAGELGNSVETRALIPGNFRATAQTGYIESVEEQAKQGNLQAQQGETGVDKANFAQGNFIKGFSLFTVLKNALMFNKNLEQNFGVPSALAGVLGGIVQFLWLFALASFIGGRLFSLS